MPRVTTGAVELEYDTFGDPAAEPLVLVMGLGTQMTAWPEPFCAALAGRGFHVVRFDNRDIGLSTLIETEALPDLGAILTGDTSSAPYVLADLAADTVGLLDALAVPAAHLVGASMGGMIVQIIAGKYPQRTRSMVSIYSTSGRRGLPQGKPEALAMLGSVPENDTREARVQHGMKLRQIIGSPGYPTPEAEMRAFVEKNVDRRWYPEGSARQYLSIIASGDRVELLKTVKVPTLVLHGEDDPLLPVACGRDVAALVPGAKIETFPGWGHDFAPGMIPTVIDRIAAFCKGK